MPKRKQRQGTGKRTQLPSGPGFEAWRMRIESLIASGKSRDAVEAAKHDLKHTPGPEAEAFAVKAYAARIEALQASGLHREAQAIGTLVREREWIRQSPKARQAKSKARIQAYEDLLNQAGSAKAEAASADCVMHLPRGFC